MAFPCSFLATPEIENSQTQKFKLHGNLKGTGSSKLGSKDGTFLAKLRRGKGF